MHITITVQADHGPSWRLDAVTERDDTAPALSNPILVEEDIIRETLQLAADQIDTISQSREGKAIHHKYRVPQIATTIDTRLLRIPDMCGLHLN